MGYYELDGEQVVKAVVQALDDDSPIRTRFSDVYRNAGTDVDGRWTRPYTEGEQAVAQFIDRLFCIVQEEIGDPEVRTEGHYWADALDDDEEE